MTGVIWEIDSGRIVKYFDTLRGARASFTRLRQSDPDRVEDEGLVVCSGEEYMKSGAITANKKVTVTTIFGKDVEICKSQVGTCCDPSTERYWSM